MITAGLFNETFYPQTLTEAADGMGGTTQTWADGTAFRGRLSSLPINERMTADKTTVFASHKLFSGNQTINEKARIRNSDSSRYFEIKGVVNPSNSNHHLEILVLEID